MSCKRRAAIVTAVLLGLLAGAGSASASFRGGDGLLAVQPSSGRGVLLVDSRGRRTRRICADAAGACGFAGAARPAWSPDGRTLALWWAGADGPPGVASVVYPDGSCLGCGLIASNHPVAFTDDPSLLTAVADIDTADELAQVSADGLTHRVLGLHGSASAEWSSSGKIAVVRAGSIWTGRPGRLHRLTAGNSPSWSPDSRRLVYVRAGWLFVATLKSRSVRRLVHGTAPAWSPDGRSIAFIDTAHRLSVVAARGGRARRIGHVTGRSVSWQPVPGGVPRGCRAPAGSVPMAATTTAEVTRDTGEPVPGNYGGIRPNAYLGCLRSDGRERVLASFRFQSGDATTDAPAAAIGGDYAALIVQSLDPHYGGSASKVEVFDLRSGSLASKLGGQGVSCPDYSYTCGSGMDELVINDQGFTAVRSTIDAQEQIQVSDDGGVRTVDTSSGGSSQALTDLQLSGDTLTWKHSGVPEQTQLH